MQTRAAAAAIRRKRVCEGLVSRRQPSRETGLASTAAPTTIGGGEGVGDDAGVVNGRGLREADAGLNPVAARARVQGRRRPRHGTPAERPRALDLLGRVENAYPGTTFEHTPIKDGMIHAGDWPAGRWPPVIPARLLADGAAILDRKFDWHGDPSRSVAPIRARLTECPRLLR